MPARQIEIQFPLKGLNEASAFVRQMGGQSGTYTTAKCNNVVSFDPATGRNRGAARSGTRKYCPDRVSGSQPGQCLKYVIANAEINSRETGPNGSPSRDTRITSSGAVRTLGPNTPMTTGARTTTLIGVSAGTVSVITPDGIVAVNSGASALSPSRPVIFAESFFKDIYFCDGAKYMYYSTASNEMIDWVAKSGGAMPAQESNVQTVSMASNATPIVVTITDHKFLNGDQTTITGVLGNTAANGTWVIANVTVDTFELIGSSGNADYISGGSCTRLSGSRASLIAVWGGRIVLSGLETDPNNIFMSAVGDAFNWDYSPEVQTVQQAVAGNITSGYGKNPDIVTALIPYTDDVMLIGGTRSIRRLLGNPAEGGISASVTDVTGIAYGSAWCQSPEGVIYFFGSRGGVYKITPENGIPNRLTALTIDERLTDIDLDATTVTLEWDDRSMSVRVYLTPNNGSATTHYVWDVRNEAWWPLSYANPLHNPRSVSLLSGNKASDRVILEYGQDGYIRVLDHDASSDDSQSIESYVYLGPFSGVMLVELYGTLSESSNNVTWAVCSASSLERALDATPQNSGTLRSGQNLNQWPRAFIETGYLRLSATGPWALETLMIGVEQASETMRRVMRRNP